MGVSSDDLREWLNNAIAHAEASDWENARPIIMVRDHSIPDGRPSFTGPYPDIITAMKAVEKIKIEMAEDILLDDSEIEVTIHPLWDPDD